MVSLRGDRCLGGSGALSGIVQVEDQVVSGSWSEPAVSQDCCCGSSADVDTVVAGGSAGAWRLSRDRSRWEPHSRRSDWRDLEQRDEDESARYSEAGRRLEPPDDEEAVPDESWRLLRPLSDWRSEEAFCQRLSRVDAVPDDEGDDSPFFCFPAAAPRSLLRTFIVGA